MWAERREFERVGEERERQEVCMVGIQIMEKALFS
jgi:hypothetical protein